MHKSRHEFGLYVGRLLRSRVRARTDYGSLPLLDLIVFLCSTITNKMGVQVGIPNNDTRNARVGEVFVYDNFVRSNVDVSPHHLACFVGTLVSLKTLHV